MMPSESSNNQMDERNEEAHSVVSYDSVGKRKSFSRLCERFADKTSMQGVPYIKNAKLRFAKLAWAVLLLIAIVCMGFHLWFLLDQYLDWPTVTKIQLNFASLPFPAITVCNTNSMHKGRLNNFNGAESLKKLVEQLNPEVLVAEQYSADYDPFSASGSVFSSSGSGSGRKRRDISDDGDLGDIKGSGYTADTNGIGDTDNIEYSGDLGVTGGTDDTDDSIDIGHTDDTDDSSGIGHTDDTDNSSDIGDTDDTDNSINIGGTDDIEGSGDTSSRVTRDTTNHEDVGDVDFPDTEPEVRVKRVVDYSGFNISDYTNWDYSGAYDYYTSGSTDGSGSGYPEFTAPKDTRTTILNTLRDLYMDLSKEDRSYLGHQVDDMVLSCVFNERVCNSSYFKLFRSSHYGNCWTLDNSIFKVLEAGPTGGLSLVLYLESTEYIEGVSEGYGLKLHVHEPNSFAFPFEEGVFIPASTETNIGLKQLSIERQGQPYGTCIDGSEFAKKYGRKFNRRSCQEMCEVTSLTAACGCMNDDTEELAEAVYPNATYWCRGNTDQTCQHQTEMKHDLQSTECNCDDPCNEVRYEKTISNRQWPTDDYAMVLLQGVCKKDPTVCIRLRQDLFANGKITNSKVLKNTFLKLNIFYEQLNFESYVEVPEIENQQFASDVGGAIGLWIGLSMLSLCELFQLLFELCDYGIANIFRERSSNKNKTRNTDRTLAQRSHSVEDGRNKIDRMGNFDKYRNMFDDQIFRASSEEDRRDRGRSGRKGRTRDFDMNGRGWHHAMEPKDRSSMYDMPSNYSRHYTNSSYERSRDGSADYYRGDHRSDR